MRLEEFEFTDEELDRYDSWSKEEVYLQYLIADRDLQFARQEIIRLERKLALIRFNLKNALEEL